jgi:hypothetical protein
MLLDVDSSCADSIFREMDHGAQEVATSSIPLKDIQFTAEGELFVIV